MRKFIAGGLLIYLRIAAKIQLLKIHPKHIVGITGSAGKSSCREAVWAILKDKYVTKQSSSGNSESGLPLDILGFGEEHNYSLKYWLEIIILTPWKLLSNWKKYDVYVAEMGVDSPDEPRNMDYLLKIIKLDIGVFLNVYPVHTEFFGKVEKIAEEKGKLITKLPKEGWAILNGDDRFVSSFKNKTQAKVLTFGEKNVDVESFLVEIPGYILADNYASNFAAAAAVGEALGIGKEESKKSLQKNFRLPPGRMSVFPGIRESMIIDSSYNASKVPMVAALDILKNQRGTRKVAVLGDMRELGELAQREHKEVAKKALEVADIIFTFGPLTENYFPESRKIRKFRKMGELIAAVTEEIKSGDIILVKGSQNTILLETLVEKLLENPSDERRLCRRGEFWERKRKELL